MNIIIMRDSDNTGKKEHVTVNSLEELMALYDKLEKETTSAAGFHGIIIKKDDYYTKMIVLDRYGTYFY